MIPRDGHASMITGVLHTYMITINTHSVATKNDGMEWASCMQQERLGSGEVSTMGRTLTFPASRFFFDFSCASRESIM
jgi:hypothetical protein